MNVQYSIKELEDRFFPIYFYRKHKDIAARDLLGLDLAPHHALAIRDWGLRKSVKNLRCSRAMGKSVLMAIDYLLDAILWPRLKQVITAGNAFRGSKAVMLEIERVINGYLSGQRDVGFARACLRDPNKPITKDAAYWFMEFTHGSIIYALPLGVQTEGQAIRGVRGQKVGIDEAFLIPTKLEQAVLDPYMNIPYDMTRQPDDQLFQNNKLSASTIDFDFRDFWKTGEYLKSVLEKNEVAEIGENRYSPDDISFFEFDMDDSYYVYNGKKQFVWMMDYYTIMKRKNLPNTDLDLWLAENKNKPLNIQGSYFSFQAIDAGMKIALRDKPEETPQVLDKCSGQCVLGIDCAPSGANTAFVVLKVGMLNSKDKDIEVCKTAAMGMPCPLLKGQQCLAKRFNIPIFAYQENKMNQRARAKLIYKLLSEYNIVAIAMDFRGGGAELADLLRDRDYVESLKNSDNPDDPPIPMNSRPIYDPERAPKMDGMPILHLYSTTQDMNLKFNGHLKGTIAALTTIFPAPLSERPASLSLLDSAGHMETLISQLSRIKAIPRGRSVTFEIETIDPQTGRTVNATKDLYSALLYADARYMELQDNEMTKTTFAESLPLPVSFTI